MTQETSTDRLATFPQPTETSPSRSSLQRPKRSLQQIRLPFKHNHLPLLFRSTNRQQRQRLLRFSQLLLQYLRSLPLKRQLRSRLLRSRNSRRLPLLRLHSLSSRFPSSR